jgi:hypothetical protein
MGQALRSLIRKHFAVQSVLVPTGRRLRLISSRGCGGRFVEGQAVLSGVKVVELGLGLMAKQAGQLGQRYRLFRGVNDCFDLCFKAHGLVGVLLSIPTPPKIALALGGTTGSHGGDEARRLKKDGPPQWRAVLQNQAVKAISRWY